VVTPAHRSGDQNREDVGAAGKVRTYSLGEFSVMSTVTSCRTVREPAFSGGSLAAVSGVRAHHRLPCFVDSSTPPFSADEIRWPAPS
jgi:hypothetical protein